MYIEQNYLLFSTLNFYQLSITPSDMKKRQISTSDNLKTGTILYSEDYFDIQ